MAGPSRITNLTDEIDATELEELYDTLELGVDDPSYIGSDSKKLKVSTLLAEILAKLNRIITIPIGDWDMSVDTTINIDLNPYVSDFTKMSVTSVTIISDPSITIGGTYLSALNDWQSGIGEVAGSWGLSFDGSVTESNGILDLSCTSTGYFHTSTSYNQTSYNRGYVTIQLAE